MRVPLGELLHGEGGGARGQAVQGDWRRRRGARKVLALADRGSSGGERERRGLGSEKAGEEGRGGGPAGGEGGEWMESRATRGKGISPKARQAHGWARPAGWRG